MLNMVSNKDREILRSLAGKARTITELPEMAERKKRWISFNALSPERPMVLCEPEGAWIELLSLAGEIFGNLLPARSRGSFWWTMGLTWEAIKLIGLENLMLFMYDQPENLHRLMAWLRDEHLHYITWFEENGLLSLNNGNAGIASGGIGYSDELPCREWKEGDRVKILIRYRMNLGV